jgi:hypothetical protein
MKKLFIALLLGAPVAAHAMGAHGMRFYGQSSAGTHLAAVLYALLAALGYWVLQHAAKETAEYVKRTGQVLGGLFIVIGLLGLLCGVTSHVKNYACPGECGGGGGGGSWHESQSGGGVPEWNMKVDEEEGGKPGERIIKVQLKSDKPAPKTK